MAGKGSQAATWSVRTPGFASFRRRLQLLGEVDTPHLRRAIDAAGHLLAGEIRGGAPGSMGQKVDVGEARGKGARVSVRVAVYHPGAKAREFGRTKWYRSAQPGDVVGIGNNTQASIRRRGAFKGKGVAYNERSVPARPFVGVKAGDRAIGRAAPEVRRLIAEGMERTWADVLAGVTDE